MSGFHLRAHRSQAHSRRGVIWCSGLHWTFEGLLVEGGPGVIIGGLTLALLVTSFFVWNSRQRNERLAIGLFIAGVVIIAVLVVVVSQ